MNLIMLDYGPKHPIWTMYGEGKLNPEALGFLPTFLHMDSKDSGADQIGRRYVSGWDDFDGFTFKCDKLGGMATLSYPNDPDLKSFAHTYLIETGEYVYLFPYGWVAVVKVKAGKNYKFEVDTVRIARID